MQSLVLRQHHQVDMRAVEVLLPIDEPLDGSDDDDDGEGYDAVVHVGARDRERGREDEEHGCYEDVDYADLQAKRWVSLGKAEERRGRTMLAVQPKTGESTKGRSPSMVRPRRQFTAIGMA